MRWPNPILGTTRVVRGFLWLPKKIRNQTRWLEHAAWTEELMHDAFGLCWSPVEWLDEEVKS